MVDWKKDIKFGEIVRHKAAGAVAEPPAEAEAGAPAATDAEDKKPLWKRELRVRKPKEEGGRPAKKPIPTAARPAKPEDMRTEAPPEAATEGARLLSRFARPTTPKPEASEGERKPSRFARPAKPAEETPKKKGRAPLAREVSFSLRRKPKAEQAEGGKAKTPKAPRGRKKAQVVGLKVGASHVAAAQVGGNEQLELVQFVREPIDRGLIVAGELRDPDALGVALKDFFRRNKLPLGAVRLGVGTNRIGVRRFEITGLQDASHLENAIRFRAQEVLPIPLEEAVLDYQVVGQETDEKGQTTYRVLLVVAYRDLIQRYVRACKVAGLKLVGIDLEAFALLRSLGPTADAARDDAAVVIVSVGHDRSTFVVADGPTCEFARVLDWGGGALDVAIARVLELTPSQAEPIKRSMTLNASQERLEGHTQEQALAVYEAVRKELQNFVRELVSSLHFYQNQPGSLGIGEITISGGTAQLPGLAAELQRLIGVSVRVGDPFARVASAKRVEPGAELGSAAVAIGLGIESS